MEAFSGVHIGYGSIRIANAGEDGNFQVYLNGTLIAENTSSVDKALNGSYNL